MTSEPLRPIQYRDATLLERFKPVLCTCHDFLFGEGAGIQVECTESYQLKSTEEPPPWPTARTSASVLSPSLGIIMYDALRLQDAAGVGTPVCDCQCLENLSRVNTAKGAGDSLGKGAAEGGFAFLP
jgi:hypothetical protein